MTKDGRYRIADEPRESLPSRFAMHPALPLLAAIIVWPAGVLLLVLNSVMLHGRQIWRELGLLLMAGVICLLGVAMMHGVAEGVAASGGPSPYVRPILFLLSLWFIFQVYRSQMKTRGLRRSLRGMRDVGADITVAAGPGEQTKPVESLRDALTADPDDARAHWLLSGHLLELERLDAAEDEARQAVGLMPEHFSGHHALALAALAANRMPVALAEMHKVLEMAPQEVHAHILEARVRRTQKRLEEAQAAVDRALQLDARSPEAIALKARLALDTGDAEAARSLAGAMLEDDPDHAEALVILGEAAARLDRGDVAAELAREALRADAGDAGALALLVRQKQRVNPLTGLWWGYNAWLLRRGADNRMLAVILTFALYRFAFVALNERGLQTWSVGVSVLWLGFCGLTWASAGLLRRMTAGEATKPRLRPDF